MHCKNLVVLNTCLAKNHWSIIANISSNPKLKVHVWSTIYSAWQELTFLLLTQTSLVSFTWNWIKNIARGTTDPGYWVYNLNHVSDWNWFEIILAEKVYSSHGLNTLGPLCLWQCFFFFPFLRSLELFLPWWNKWTFRLNPIILIIICLRYMVIWIYHLIVEPIRLLSKLNIALLLHVYINIYVGNDQYFCIEILEEGFHISKVFHRKESCLNGVILEWYFSM